MAHPLKAQTTMRTHSPVQASANPSHIRGLDGIRACAFLLVLCGHCGFSWIPNGFGVTVFFFLSGYLITTLLRKEWIHNGSISVSHFYVRRAFRILPPLYCALILAIALALTGATHSEVHWKAVAAIQLFLTNYSDLIVGASVPLGLSVLWLLAVEEHFYLVFPWVYRALLKGGMRRSRQVVLLGCICLLALVWRTVLMSDFHVFWNRVYTGTDTRLDSILFGSIMAIAVNPVIDRLDRITRRRCAIAAVIGVVVLIVSIAMRGELFRQTLRYTVQGVALFPIFVYVIRYSDSTVTRIMEWKVLTHIGDLSYSLYVVHYTVMFVVKIWVTTNPFLTLLITFTVSYIIAEFMRRYVELPSVRMRNRVLERTRANTVAQEASPAT